MPYYAFVTAWRDNALTIFDVTNPAAPTHVGVIRGPGAPNWLWQAWGLQVVSSLAYVAVPADFALTIINVANPATPIFVGSIQDAGPPIWLIEARWVHVVGNLAYVAVRGASALTIIDVTNPAAPAWVSSILGGGAPPWLGQVQHIQVVGNLAYLAAQGDNRLTIIDVTNPVAPAFVSTIGGAGAPNWLDGAFALQVVGNFVYVIAYADNSLSIFNVTNPAVPVLVGNIRNIGFTWRGPRGIHVVGHLAYIACYDDSVLAIIDVTNPAAPVLVSTFGGPGPPNFLGSATGVQVIGNLAYVVSVDDASLTIVDVTNPAAPVLVSSIQGIGGPNWLDGANHVNVMFFANPPVVSTQAATSATLTNATLNGILTDDGGEVCDVRFEYGNDPTALISSTAWQPGFHTGGSFSAPIALLPLVTYFRAAARNSAGTRYGAILSVWSAGVTVETRPATGITENAATLNGYLQTDGGSRCECRFQWGAASSYGMETPWVDGFHTGDAFAAALGNLSGGVLYHFRAQARMGGTIYSGRDMQFVTLTPAHMMTLLPVELVQKLG